MDEITKFEKILDLVERARKLDFIALEVMERLNQHNLDIYSQYNRMNSEITKKDTHTVETQKKDADMDENALKEAVMHLVNQVNKLKEQKEQSANIFANPLQATHSTPIPPEPEEQPVIHQAAPQIQVPTPTPTPTPTPLYNKDTAFIDRIKGMSGTVADRIKTQADMLKHVMTVVNETHRMSFTLWKEMDDYLKTRPTKPPA